MPARSRRQPTISAATLCSVTLRPLRPARPAARSMPSNSIAVEFSSMPVTMGSTSARLSEPPGPKRAASSTAGTVSSARPSLHPSAGAISSGVRSGSRATSRVNTVEMPRSPSALNSSVNDSANV